MGDVRTLIFEKMGITMETETRIKALAKYLECDIDDLSESKWDDKTIENGSEEYLVVDDEEANVVWEERLESYIEECILGQLPEHLQTYFDNESWMEDARMDGRGHSISSYDGGENEIEIDGETIYIFRLN